MANVIPGSETAGAAAPLAVPKAAARGRPKPASYPVALLLVLAVIVSAEVAGDALRPLLRQGGLTTQQLLLIGVGGSALIGLVVLNARWLWATLGNLRFALALITIWGVSSILGTLVVQRFPNQTDSGYARGFISATGDFLWNVTHSLGGTVIVHPEPDVQLWLDEQRRLFGAEQGEETAKTWLKSEQQRLRAMEIEDYTRRNEPLLRDVLAFVSALRLPEAFQMSVWFKALLGLLCVALVTVVIQRWRGEWRQVGWAMAHLGMVTFIVGASVRATGKVDGLLPMHVGETTDSYFRNVAEATGPFAVVKEGKQAVLTPLDFQLTLHRFKTEYPKHLAVSLAASEEIGGVSKTYRVDPGWNHPFLDGRVAVHVDRALPNAAAVRYHREDPAAPPNPAVLLALAGDWLDAEQEFVLHSGEGGFAPPDNGYHLQYRHAEDEAEFARLTEAWEGPSHRGLLVLPDGTPDGTLLGEARPGAVIEVPGEGDRTLTVLAVWPDHASRSAPDGAEAAARDPAAQLELRAAGERLGEVWAFTDRTVADPGLSLPSELAELTLDYDFWSSPSARHYRIVDRPGTAPVLATFAAGAPPDVREVPLGTDLTLGEQGDRLRLVAAFERHSSGWTTGPADTSGMTPDDVYYASLPTALELTVRGPDVANLARHFTDKVLPSFGIVLDEDFERGEGFVAATPDGAGLRVRLLSDHPELSRFPDELISVLAVRSDGRPLPFVLDWFTNERGAPLRFTSDVTLSQNGRVLKRGLVEPNRPMYLAGWQFSQADFNPQDPTYSAFGVVRDPSVRIVYFGMGVLVLGVILLFYVSPLIARRTGGRSLV